MALQGERKQKPQLIKKIPHLDSMFTLLPQHQAAFYDQKLKLVVQSHQPPLTKNSDFTSWDI